MIPPTVYTLDASTSRGGTNGLCLVGNITDFGGYISCKYWFEYGITEFYEYSTSHHTTIQTGEVYDRELISLKPNTTYHFRACVSNGAGASYGEDKSFTTEQQTSPIVNALATTNVQATSATLNGFLSRLGGAPSCDVLFEYGLNENYGSQTARQTKTTTGPFSADILDLTPGTTYYFRAYASNSLSANMEIGCTFTTPTQSNKPPICTITANSFSGYAPFDVTFSVTASDSDGSIASYKLKICDYGGSTENSGEKVPSTQHTIYETPGDYCAYITVKDNKGATSSDNIIINVKQPTNQPFSCSLSANPISGSDPPLVKITMRTLHTNVRVASWSLDIDNDGNAEYSDYGIPPIDSQSLDDNHPEIMYESPGTYTIKLTVTDEEGVSVFDTKTITVNKSIINTITDMPDFDFIGLIGAIVLLFAAKRKR
ncbi:MAG: PKD domain-containing protein [Candidatus Thermoplasmatota archaeon]|nr:PKD domain-containing protein [Candidatus Thermoplasmatota archaeon]